MRGFVNLGSGTGDFLLRPIYHHFQAIAYQLGRSGIILPFKGMRTLAVESKCVADAAPGPAVRPESGYPLLQREGHHGVAS